MLRVIVLTSRENFVRYSMQEIIPYIESTWADLNSEDYDVVTFNIDTLSLSELTPKLIGADRVVATCFNYRMCKVMQYIREILQLNINFFIHAHHLSTIAFWPYRYFSSSEIFCKSDVFITSCENDKKVLEQVFQNPIVHVIPFFIKGPIRIEKECIQPPRNIVYVGRISPQKNLHNILLAYSYVKKQITDMPALILFGTEDHLGSPNMNIRNENYLQFLSDLCEKLDIKPNVFFKGHVDRELVDDFLFQKSNLFISASLHSDENFGISALQAILARNQTLLSDWGGHSDFKRHFPELVDVMPVVLSEYGPTLSAGTIAEHLLKALKSPVSLTNFDIPEYYQSSYYLNEQKKALQHEFSKSPLYFSSLANRIYEAKMDYTTSSTQIFSSFSDPLFKEISQYYAGPAQPIEFPENHFHFQAVPWLTYADEIFMIDDPHKGPLMIQNDQDDLKPYHLAISQQTLPISTRICQKLFLCGYINKSEKLMI